VSELQVAKDNLWLDVSNLQNADKAIRYGSGAAAFVATVTAMGQEYDSHS
jgi:hypothetical protein